MTDWKPYAPPLGDKMIDWQALVDSDGEHALIVGKDVLDVGAFWGVDAFMFADKAKSYVVCDNAPAVLDHLRAKMPKQVTVTWCDLMERWPWADASVDTVLDFSTLDDTPRPRHGLLEALRVLRPGGVILTTYANANAIGPGAGYTASRPGDLADFARRSGFRVLRRFNERSARAAMVLRKREAVFDMVTMEQVRRAWTSAQGFPVNKEDVYAGHAEAHGFDAEAGKTVLEYGCGGGSDTLSLLRRGCRVFYADVTLANVEVTKARIAELLPDAAARAEGLALDASDRIPIPDASVDAVTSHGVVHHIEDALAVVREFHRVLKPGGRAYVMLYTEHLRARADEVIHNLAKERGLPVEEGFCWFTDGPGHPWAEWYTVERGAKLLSDAGFENTGHKEYNRSAANYDLPDFRTFRAVKL